MRSVIVFQFRFIRQKFFMQMCHLIFIGLRRQWIETISLLQCNDTHLHGTLKGWKFIVCFRVWQLAILQMGYPHCNINKLYHGDKEHNREKRKPLITHQKAAFVKKKYEPWWWTISLSLCTHVIIVWPKTKHMFWVASNVFSLLFIQKCGMLILY